jgi:hypothetical protein
MIQSYRLFKSIILLIAKQANAIGEEEIRKD